MRISDWSSDVCSSDLKKGRGDGSLENRRPVGAHQGDTFLYRIFSNLVYGEKTSTYTNRFCYIPPGCFLPGQNDRGQSPPATGTRRSGYFQRGYLPRSLVSISPQCQ